MTQATYIQPANKAKTADAVISTENLTKVYRDGKSSVKALDGLTMTVPEGSIFGFLGPNGSGKSTTIRMLVGLAKATSGRAQVAGAYTDRNPQAVRAHVGYLAQSPLFYYYMTGRETLEYVAATGAQDVITDSSRSSHADALARSIRRELGIPARASKNIRSYELGG
jgi:ABC-2 type transport system ATP-binding protein